MSRWRPGPWAVFGLGAAAGALLVLAITLAPHDGPQQPGGAVTRPGPPRQARARRASTTVGFLGVVVPEQVIEVVAPSDGQLRELRVQVGDEVAAEEVLARLDTTMTRHELAIERAALASAEAEHQRVLLRERRLKAEHQRRRALTDVLSREELARAEADLAEIEAQLGEAEAETAQVQARIARLETLLERAEIRAPAPGIVSARYLDPGTVVTSGTAILRLISDHQRRVRFAVPPADAASIVPGTAVRIELDGLDLDINGVVERLAPEIDAASQMLFAEARLVLDPDTRIAAGTPARITRLDPGATPSGRSGA